MVEEGPSSWPIGLTSALIYLLPSSFFSRPCTPFPGFSHSREIPGGLVSCLDPGRWASSRPIIVPTIGLRALWPLRCRIRPRVLLTLRLSSSPLNRPLSPVHRLSRSPGKPSLSARPGRSGQGCKDLQAPSRYKNRRGYHNLTLLYLYQHPSNRHPPFRPLFNLPSYPHLRPSPARPPAQVFLGIQTGLDSWENFDRGGGGGRGGRIG